MSEPLPPAPELRALGAAQVDQLAAMVFELAGQLHEERARVRELERRLAMPSGTDLSDDLNRSIARLLAVAAERDDARAPLIPTESAGGMRGVVPPRDSRFPTESAGGMRGVVPPREVLPADETRS
ncbi:MULTISPECIES: hypothetical protein [Thermomonosporaceae]|uniref:hypothetical protein n=1 Tax=Thermomonosporaceae TaxID=2012 RepID=UPI00255AD36E|nr:MULTISPECIES: hypothetical protein [Thermomonosporaceae]MDL4774150.1 hypothetical protein [Actinomadura xylanilytica]